MSSSLIASLNKLALFNTMFCLNKSSNFIERDELSKKNPSRKKVKKGNHFLGNREPLISRKEQEDNNNNMKKKKKNSEEKGVTRVKVKMTKQEANRLMAKCKEDGVLEFRDVAHELAQIPVNRVTVVSSSVFLGYGDQVLRAIPEEINN